VGVGVEPTRRVCDPVAVLDGSREQALSQGKQSSGSTSLGHAAPAALRPTAAGAWQMCGSHALSMGEKAGHSMEPPIMDIRAPWGQGRFQAAWPHWHCGCISPGGG